LRGGGGIKLFFFNYLFFSNHCLLAIKTDTLFFVYYNTHAHT